MSKLLIIIGLLINMMYITAYGQPRSIDMEAVMDAPAPGGIYQADIPTPFIISIKNHGPDVLIAGDTLFISLPDNTVQPLLLTQEILMGETKEIMNAEITLVADSNMRGDLCVYIVGDPNSILKWGGKPISVSYTDPDTINNKACNEITVEKEHASSIDLFSLKDSQLILYPNPCSSKVKLLWNKQIKGTIQVTMTDFLGKNIVLKNRYDRISKENFVELDMTGIQNGLYIITVNDGYKSYYQKIVVQH